MPARHGRRVDELSDRLLQNGLPHGPLRGEDPVNRPDPHTRPAREFVEGERGLPTDDGTTSLIEDPLPIPSGIRPHDPNPSSAPYTDNLSAERREVGDTVDRPLRLARGHEREYDARNKRVARPSL
ncbi:hypothetical protein TPA0906_49900 [Streptomyces olivaceus]|nr:hypothetical protein TPA0906_49900 [Streptomyces olivaceus]